MRIRALPARVPVRGGAAAAAGATLAGAVAVLLGVPSWEPFAEGPLLHRPRVSRCLEREGAGCALALMSPAAGVLGPLGVGVPFVSLPFSCAGRDCLTFGFGLEVTLTDVWCD